MLYKVHLYYIVIFLVDTLPKKWTMRLYYIILSIQYEMELVLVNNAWNTVYLWNKTEAALVRPPLSYSTVFQTIMWVCLCVFYSHFFCDVFVLWKASLCLWSDKSAALSKTSTPLLWSVWAVLFVHAYSKLDQQLRMAVPFHVGFSW